LSKLKKIGLLFRTIRHLKPIQVLFQLYYRLNKVSSLSIQTKNGETIPLRFIEMVETNCSVDFQTKTFTFLNLSKSFENEIDWNFNDFGRLWNYNLQYLDYLKLSTLKNEDKVELIDDLYKQLIEGKVVPEPYPSSLRIMNLIRFVSLNQLLLEDKNKINQYILAEMNFLDKRLEFHILANHLLENLFAMHMAALYVGDVKLQKKYEKLLTIQLKEQILNDGAHYEVSTMYHNIIFYRVLELYNTIQEDTEFKITIKSILIRMRTWLENMSFKNSKSPDFNDSTSGVACTNQFLIDYCEKLNIDSNKQLKLKDSAYRKMEVNDFEFIIDVNGIQPSYQPGHAHADTFSFCLNYKNKEIVVDPGISTYNIGERRNWERSTLAHNTLEVDKKNSSEVWSGFRVGRRAHVTILKDNDSELEAYHDGYSKNGVKTIRTVKKSYNSLEIIDSLHGNLNGKATIHFYFAPNLSIQSANNSIMINENLIFEFDSGIVSIDDYDYCLAYNSLCKAKHVAVELTSNSIHTTIKER
jgi:hypothetical protein